MDSRIVHRCVPGGGQTQEAFRADAKAEGEEVVLGGWLSLNGLGTKEAPWYSVRLDRTNAAWAFARGEPFRNIAALEMMATLFCVM